MGREASSPASFPALNTNRPGEEAKTATRFQYLSPPYTPSLIIALSKPNYSTCHRQYRVSHNILVLCMQCGADQTTESNRSSSRILSGPGNPVLPGPPLHLLVRSRVLRSMWITARCTLLRDLIFLLSGDPATTVTLQRGVLSDPLRWTAKKPARRSFTLSGWKNFRRAERTLPQRVGHGVGDGKRWYRTTWDQTESKRNGAAFWWRAAPNSGLTFEIRKRAYL
jgi:hypothetical protein